MPKNVTGLKCVLCGFCFESKRYDSRNRIRKVHGDIFWPKYCNYNEHVKFRTAVERTDVLCSSCYVQIDRFVSLDSEPNTNCNLKKGLEKQKVDELRLKKNTMSSQILVTGVKRQINSQDKSNKKFNVPQRDNSRATETQTSAVEKSNEDEVLCSTQMDGTMDCTVADYNEKMNAETTEKGSVEQECEDLPATMTENNSSTLSCATVSSLHSVCETGLTEIIREMTESGTVYNDNLNFLLTNGVSWNLKVNRQIMRLWHIRPYSKNVTTKPIRLDDCHVRFIEHVIKYIHAGVTPGFEEFFQIVATAACGMVNHFLLGLFLYESLSKFTDGQLKDIVEEISQNKSTSVTGKIILFFIKNHKSLKIHLLEAFKFLENTFDVWNGGTFLDGEENTNLSGSQKFYFYYWLYSEQANEPGLSVMGHVLSTLKPTSSSEADECFDYIMAETSGHSCIRVHSFILFLRQEVTYEEYLLRVNSIRSNLRNRMYSKPCLELFVEILYFGGRRFKKNKKYSLITSLIDLAQLFCVKRPLKLFGYEACQISALDVRLLVELFLKTGSKEYIDCLLREPMRNLTIASTKLLNTVQMYTLLIQDELQLQEIDVYNLVIQFSKEKWCDDEDEVYKSFEGRLDKLICTVRFGIMNEIEINQIIKEGHVPFRELTSFFFLIHHPEAHMLEIPDKFHQPTSKRKLTCNS